MRYYSAMIRIAGDQNHQTPRRDMPAPELRILQAIHGLDSVVQIRDQGERRTPEAEVKEYLEKTYKQTRIGIDSDRGVVLSKVYPSWPHVDLPHDARKFIDPVFFAEKTVVEDAKERSPGGQAADGAVPRNTYWLMEETGELGMTEKGDVLPEGVKPVKKDTWEQLKAKQQEEAAGQEGSDDGFLE